jgi:hypothetical protein
MRTALPATLLGLALLLGVATATALIAPTAPEKIEDAGPPRPLRVVEPPPYAAPGEERFADRDARPLFSSLRKPLNEPEQAAGAAAPASDFSLVGVIMGSERAVALLRLKSTSATLSAVVGGTVNGWHVARIDATSVTLRANGSEVVVALEAPGDRAPGAPLEAGSPAPAPIAPPAAPPSAAPPPTTAPPAPHVATAPAGPQPTPVAATAPAKPYHPTIAPDALKGAPRDPTTGEPTL